MADVFTDLAIEGDAVDGLLEGLTDERWALPTPAPGWAIAHQIAHLAATFKIAGLAAADPDTFTAVASRLSPDFDANVAHALSPYVKDPPEVLRARWREERDTAFKALAALTPDTIVPWLVRPLPAAVLAAAGMMELFGHGQDIADALGVERPATGRLRHLAAFGARVYDFGYLARGLTVPEAPFAFRITGPGGTPRAAGRDHPANRAHPGRHHQHLLHRDSGSGQRLPRRGRPRTGPHRGSADVRYRNRRARRVAPGDSAARAHSDRPGPVGD